MGNSQRLTEYQAWKFLAAKWNEAASEADGELYYSKYCWSGMCASMSKLAYAHDISETTYSKMLNKISKYKKKHKIYNAYFWPTDVEHAKKRASFCRARMAEITLRRKVKQGK